MKIINKLTTICTFCILSLLSPSFLYADMIYAQSVMLSVHLENRKVEDILSHIQKQSEFYFVYNSKLVDVDRITSVHAENKSVEVILNEVFKNTNVTYEIVDNQIVLKAGNTSPSVAQQQKRRVTGVVSDSTGETIIGANVIEKGTNNGTITDLDGSFALEVSENAVLVVTYIGLSDQEIKVGHQMAFNIVLQDDNQLLNEVVIVGYGAQKKVNMTGSVATISSSSIESRPITNVSTALAGLAAGVRVNQSSSKPGEDGATIRLRGQGTLSNNDILVIIDGVEGVLDAVNPNDIESISVLKDAASASIYGARAGNGVILVTTKMGSKGKPKISFSGTLSMAKPTRLPEYITDYANYMEVYNESLSNIGSSLNFAQSTIDLWREAAKNPNGLTENGYPNWLVYPNTDWADAVFENNWIQNYNISVTGGTETSRYAFSAGYLNNPGLVDRTGAERFQARVNLESDITGFFTVGTYTFMSMLKKQKGTINFDGIRQSTPGLYPYQYDGYWSEANAPGEEKNSSMLSSLYNTGGKDLTSRVNTTMFARLKLLKGLVFETKVNYQARFVETNSYPLSSSVKNFANEAVKEPESPEQMRTSYTFEKNYTLTYDNTLRYNFSILRDHNFGLLAGHNEYYYNTYKTSSSKKGLIAEGIYAPDAAGVDDTKFTGTEKDRSMRSFFGRVNYDYQSKYLFEFNIRYDGSSRFGEDRRWGTFPSVSAGWRVMEESFAEPLKPYLQNLKLRGSWGKLGNDAAGEYDYQAFYDVARYNFGNQPVTGLGQSKMGNALLQWEETTVKDFALEANFLNNRAFAEVNYYDKYTSGILTTPPVYQTAGDIKGPTQNTADVSNRGVEITLGWNDKIDKVRYSVKGNFSYNKNQVQKYKGAFEVDEDGIHNLSKVSTTSNSGYIVEGHTIGEYFVRRLYRGDGSYFNSDGSVNIHGGPTAGMIRTEKDMEWLLAMKDAGYTFSPTNTVGESALYYGDFIYADLNGDGTYGDVNDQEFTGQSILPKYNYGFTIDVAWNNFDLSMIWAGSAGMHYYFLAKGYNDPEIRPSGAISTALANDHYFYDPQNPSDPRTNLSSDTPRLRYAQNSIHAETNERWIYNASYLKLKNLQIGYTIPAHITKKASVENVRLYVSGENLLMFTPYPFMDPERGAGIGYLPMKQFAFGVNINF